MKLKAIIGSALALTFGLSFSAQAGSYYPSDSLSCHLKDEMKLECNNFSHDYLSEDTYTADFNGDQYKTFNFTSAVAYYTPNHDQVTVFYTYSDANGPKSKMVKLKTINTSISPDLEHGGWQELKSDIYTCNVSASGCPITNLPKSKK